MGAHRQRDTRSHLLRSCLAVLVGCYLASSTAVASGQGELGSLRTAVRDSKAPPQPKSKPKPDKNAGHGKNCHCWKCCNDDDDDDDLEASAVAFLGIVIGGAITTPWWGPPLMLEDNYSVEGYFARYPYKGQSEGYMMIHPWLPEEPHIWSGRANVEYGTSFDNLDNITTKFLFETTSRWGLDSEITYRSEDLGGGVKDDLLTGDFNAVFRFGQSPHAQFRTGIGVNYLSDEIDDEIGFNFTYGFDIYPAKPWVFSNELDWGRLGDVHLFHYRSTVGRMIHAGEIYIGVDYFDVGPMDVTTMVSGVRIWF